MSHIHFVANKSYKKNVIQLGEDPKNGKDYEKLQEATVKMSNLELEYLTLIEEEERLKLQLDG